MECRTSMIVVEEWSWYKGVRLATKTEHKDITSWEKSALINTIAGTIVGYKIYDATMAEFDELSSLGRSKIVIKQKFDKDAYIAHKGEWI